MFRVSQEYTFDIRYKFFEEFLALGNSCRGKSDHKENAATALHIISNQSISVRSTTSISFHFKIFEIRFQRAFGV